MPCASLGQTPWVCVVVVRSGIIRSSFETIVVVVAPSTLLFSLFSRRFTRALASAFMTNQINNGENNDMVGNGGALIGNP